MMCRNGHAKTLGDIRCRVCQRIANRRAVDKYRVSTKGRAICVKANRTLRRKRKVDLLALFGGKCVDCGFDGHFAALEFDHLDPKTKKFTIGASGTARTWNALVEEAKKCEIVCSNCHKVRTYNRHVERRLAQGIVG